MQSTSTSISTSGELIASHDGRFVVTNSEPAMTAQLEALQRACFPTLASDELMLAAHYAKHIEVFPEGQHVVLDTDTGRVVASSSDLRIRLDLAHYQHRFIEAVGHNWFTTHVPDGDWLYGADIGVLPEYRGFGLSGLLYEARQNLVRRLGLAGHCAGAMPKGYGPLKDQMPIEAYMHKVIAGELRDPVVSVQLKRGYRVYGIIPDYIDDESSANMGVLIVWRNPDRRW